MIKKSDDYVAWALLMHELADARDHLDGLIRKISEADTCDEVDLAIDLGHIYAHLNRFWHSRNQVAEMTEDQLSVFSQFPKDLKPVG